MINRYFFYILGLKVMLLSTFTAAAQQQFTEAETKDLLKNIDASLNNIHTLVYKITYDNKYLSRRDTIHKIAVCSLYIAPKDKMKAYNIVDAEFTELQQKVYGHRRYDGKSAFWINYPIDSLNKDIKPQIFKKSKEVRNVVENYSTLLLKEYLTLKNTFGRYESAAGMIHVAEEVHMGVPVYVLSLKFRDTEETKDNVDKHYIRKSDFLPIAYSSFLRWENMEQYNYYEVQYISINPDIPLEAFKVNPDDTINATERYRALSEKINTINP